MYVLGYGGFTRNTRLRTGQRSLYAKTGQDFNTIFEFREGEVPFSMFPLGYFGHDASAALLLDGNVIACAAEERFTRVKYSLDLAGNTLLPRNAIRYCLVAAGISIHEVDMVAHYCNFTKATVDKRLELLRRFISSTDALRVERSYQQVFQSMMEREVVCDQFKEMTGAFPKRFFPVSHHKAHAASAFYPSRFKEALILTIDGTGELESSLLAVGRNGHISEIESSFLPTSLGALYLLITVYLGFNTLGDEYKVMGLASYGDQGRFGDVFSELVTLDDSGKYSTPWLGKAELKELILKKLGPPRKRNDPFEKRHADIAAALQQTLNHAVLHRLRYAQAKTGMADLCMAGGVALNCTLNGVIARSGLFRNIFVQPSANDEGCSAGAALYAYVEMNKNSAVADMGWEHVYLGPGYNDNELLAALETVEDKITWCKSDNIGMRVAQELAGGKVAGWFQGRMEFGPRALGNRSILADPRDAGMKDRINEKVKRRESFRPFAPAVLEEDANEFFDLTGIGTSPFMLFTVPVRESKRGLIPAVTHVDGTARIQTVSRKTNQKFWNLIAEFENITGVPVVLNTSFNVRNEPIVCSPHDALLSFLSTNIDCLGMGDFFVQKRSIE